MISYSRVFAALLFLPAAPLHVRQMSVKNCFIRGSVVRYVLLPASEVDTELLQDSTRIEAREQKKV